MTDVIINRIKKTVWIKTMGVDLTYTWINDNVNSSGKWYVIEIEKMGVEGKGKIILPCDRTNMITFG